VRGRGLTLVRLREDRPGPDPGVPPLVVVLHASGAVPDLLGEEGVCLGADFPQRALADGAEVAHARIPRIWSSFCGLFLASF